ncbi:hypothetical protein BDFB_006927, partial [Asbolus verrucosus]
MEEINYEQAIHFTDFIDPFIVLKKLFLEFGYSQFAKVMNGFILVFHSAAFLLQVNFIINNFSLDLFVRYGCVMSFTVYVLTSILCSMILERDIRKLLAEQEKHYWSIDSAGHKARGKIAERAKKVNNFSYLHFAFLALAIILLLPQFGGHDEWFLGVRVFEDYFGPWARIPFIRTIFEIVQPVMVILVFLGVLTICGVDASNILKIRLICAIVIVEFMGYMYCAAGQLLIDETGCIHTMLMGSPWYIWNIKNRKALLIFMNNCLEPIKFSFAGITLDHQLILA